MPYYDALPSKLNQSVSKQKTAFIYVTFTGLLIGFISDHPELVIRESLFQKAFMNSEYCDTDRN